MIRPLSAADIPNCADIVRKSFEGLFEKFNIPEEECPGHAGPEVEAYIATKFTDGGYPFGYFVDNRQIGFVSLTDKGGGVFEMNWLTVLPKFRHFGYGKNMLDFCKEKVTALGGKKIIIEILDANTVLKNWYAANGFIFIGTAESEGISFLVGRMEWEVSP